MLNQPPRQQTRVCLMMEPRRGQRTRNGTAKKVEDEGSSLTKHQMSYFKSFETRSGKPSRISTNFKIATLKHLMSIHLQLPEGKPGFPGRPWWRWSRCYSWRCSWCTNHRHTRGTWVVAFTLDFHGFPHCQCDFLQATREILGKTLQLPSNCCFTAWMSCPPNSVCYQLSAPCKDAIQGTQEECFTRLHVSECYILVF